MEWRHLERLSSRYIDFKCDVDMGGGEYAPVSSSEPFLLFLLCFLALILPPW